MISLSSKTLSCTFDNNHSLDQTSILFKRMVDQLIWLWVYIRGLRPDLGSLRLNILCNHRFGIPFDLSLFDVDSLAQHKHMIFCRPMYVCTFCSNIYISFFDRDGNLRRHYFWNARKMIYDCSYFGGCVKRWIIL